jgi:glycerophosphoryl diester phosphodiesterase
MSSPAILKRENAIVIAHRGASAYAPEHTLAAYDLALQMGADYIEQDLQMTSDGVLVVMHDDTLDRTTRGAGCSGRVILRTLEEVRRCSAGRWFGPEFAEQRIPTLQEVLERYVARARFYIETKNPDEAPGMETMLVALLEAYGLTVAPGAESLPAVIIQSFSADSLRQVAELAPALPRVQLIENVHSTRIIAQLDGIARYAHGIGPSRRSVDAALMDAARTHSLAVHPYTVNDESEMRRLLALGVDGMFTDHPDRLLALR